MRISDWSSDVCSSDLLARLERLDHRDRGIGGDGEVDADVRADRRDQHVGDADDIALQVEQRTARLAAVDRGIGLDIAVIGAAAGVALHGRADARVHRRAEPDRIAGTNHPTPAARLSTVAALAYRHTRTVDI